MTSIEFFVNASGKTTSELAEEMGVTRPTIYNMIKGKWTRQGIKKLAKVLGVKPIDLVRNELSK